MLDTWLKFDDQVMEKYLNGQSLTEDEVRRVVRARHHCDEGDPVSLVRLSRIRVCSFGCSCGLSSSLDIPPPLVWILVESLSGSPSIPSHLPLWRSKL